jgi:general L-amino acid transport system permease protein
MTTTRASEDTSTPVDSRRATGGAWDWVRSNLFNTWYNTLLTALLLGVGAWAVVSFLRFIFTTGFEIIRVNLKLFMVGDFPSDQLWRPWLALGLLAVMVGGSAGSLAATARDRAVETGQPNRQTRITEVSRRFAPVILLAVVILSFTRTPTPALLTVGVVALGVIAYLVGRRLPGRVRSWTWLFIVLMVIAIYVALAGFGGVGWHLWEGLLLGLFLTVAGILFAFPLGLLLALGRRSSLPAVRTLSVGYIELIRGVPLIALLLFAAFSIGFLVPSDLRPSPVTRMLIAITAFEAAYIAEVVRGGLQAVPNGQAEAAQALGLGPWKTMRLIVLPQALRATIPAMVGQFISLFKDTTLVVIVAGADLLHYAFIVNSQEAFLGKGLFVITLGFAAFIYWVGSYTMSREARRLEKRLGVGER